MSAPNKEARQKCYAAKESYWECLKYNDDESKCADLRQVFQDSCPKQWFKHMEELRKARQMRTQVLGGAFDKAVGEDD